jgi:hypothetical protein
LRKTSRRGYSDVISSLILTTVVITVGIGVWGYAAGASSNIQSDYFNEVSESVYKIQERLNVESIAINLTASPRVTIWLTNYGYTSLNITKITLSGGGNNHVIYPNDPGDSKTKGWEILTGQMVRLDLDPDTVKLTSGSSITISILSERGNIIYENHKVPQKLPW